MQTIKIFNHKKELVSEVRSDVSQARKINELDIYSIEFSVSKDSPSATEDGLRFGNYVKIKDLEGLILPPRQWTAEKVTAWIYYPAELVKEYYKQQGSSWKL